MSRLISAKTRPVQGRASPKVGPPQGPAGVSEPIAARHKIRFTSRESAAFIVEVRSEAARWFEAANKSDKANIGMYLKTVLMLGVLGGGYALLLTRSVSDLAFVGTLVLMGVAMAGIGFCVAHDALHGAYSSKPWVNTALGGSFDLLGANSYMWKITHNIIHHTYTNIHGVDEDLSVSPLLRLSPEAPRLGIHRWQHWYALAAYSTSTLFWVFVKDFKYFLRRDLAKSQRAGHQPGAIAWLLTSKVVYLGYAVALPLALIARPWWQILAGFVLMHLVAGVILGIVFQLAHVVEGTSHLLPDSSGVMEHDWAVHEMMTTANFACSNPAVTWFVGGLNHQIEHHLFPKVCSVHYPHLSSIVRSVAARHGIEYHEHVTVWKAWKSHFRTLRVLGRQDQLEVASAA